METLETVRLIDELQAILREQIFALEQMRTESNASLFERPSPERWSVAEIAEHLNLSSGHYFKLLRKVYADPKSKLRFSSTFEPGRFGEMGVKAMRPDQTGAINWKMKTLGMFEPKATTAKGIRAMEELRSMLEGFIELLEMARTRGLEGEKITSTLGPILRFKVGDAFRFPVAHQQRHFLQMERTLASLRERTAQQRA